MEKTWEPIVGDILMFDSEGCQLELKGVPGIKDVRGRVMHSLYDIMRAEQETRAKDLGIETRQVLELLLMVAPIRFSRAGFFLQKYRFNKILFYVAEELKILGFEPLNFEEFAAARAGPVPIHLKEDLNTMERQGWITQDVYRDGKKVPRVGGNLESVRARGSLRCELTAAGEAIAKQLWRKAPGEVQELLIRVKESLFYLDATALKDKVHAEYPEYKKSYTQLDEE